MNKVNLKLDVLKKVIARLIKAAPARKPDPPEPLPRLVRAFLEYDCDEARAVIGERKILDAMVDLNELRVTPAIELAALLGIRYPFAESRCSAMHRTLQSIFDREHQMKMDRLKELKKAEVRPYLQSLGGIAIYVEAVVALECFDIPAAPVDTKLLLWLISKEALPEDTDPRTAQQILEKHIKASDMADFHRGARKEIDDWQPKTWPPMAKVPSPMLPPPGPNDKPEMEPARMSGKAPDAKPAVDPKKAPAKAPEAAKPKPPVAAAGKKK